MDYVSLTGAKTVAGSIAGWINSSQVVSEAPTIVAEAESWIYRRLRHWRMRKEATGIFTIGSDAITLPADYLEDEYLMITGQNMRRLPRQTLEQVKSQYSYDGNSVRVNQPPCIFYNDAASLRFDSPSDQAYPYELDYFAQPAALSGTNLTNFITQFYPRLMRLACMAGAAEFMKDAGQGQFDRTYWDQLAMAELGIAQAESDHAQRSLTGGAICE